MNAAIINIMCMPCHSSRYFAECSSHHSPTENSSFSSFPASCIFIPKVSLISTVHFFASQSLPHLPRTIPSNIVPYLIYQELYLPMLFFLSHCSAITLSYNIKSFIGTMLHVDNEPLLFSCCSVPSAMFVLRKMEDVTIW